MNQDDPIPDGLSCEKVYSAPRRFDLATLFVVMIIYSCLLGISVALGLPEKFTLSILGFLTVIGVSQPALFGGNKPRLASVMGGGISLPLLFALFYFQEESRFSSLATLLGCLCIFPLGACLGYCAGALVGGVFLVADVVRHGHGVR